MLAEELSIIDPESVSWQAIRPLLTVAVNIEQSNDYVWCGWSKPQITGFLEQLPAHCAFMVGVWATDVDTWEEQGHETLQVGFVGEVRAGEVCTIRTFESLVGVPPIQELEPGAEHALALIRQVRVNIAPVAWALFTDKETWDEWIYGGAGKQDNEGIDKGALLMTFARQGRCVLMGSQARHQM